MYKLSTQRLLARTIKGSLFKEMNHLTFFVTSMCNLRCKYCFNAKRLGTDEKDLTIEEIEKIIEKLPSTISSILFSGGEPWIREDFIEIIGLFVKKGILDFGIPSNGVNTNLVSEKMKIAAEKYKNASFVYCVSIDPFEEIHNKFRGQGSFEKAIETAKIAAQISKHHSNVLSVVNSVISPEAVPFIEDFLNFIHQEVSPSLHTIDMMRIPEMDKKFNDFSDSDYEIIKKSRIKIEDLYRKKSMMSGMFKKRSRIITDVQKEVIKNNGKWPVRCPAGRTSAVLYSNGDVAFCENHPSVGNIRENNFDLIRTLNLGVSKYLLMTKSHACDCNHIVYLRQAVEYNFPKLLLKSIFR